MKNRILELFVIGLAYAAAVVMSHRTGFVGELAIVWPPVGVMVAAILARGWTAGIAPAFAQGLYYALIGHQVEVVLLFPFADFTTGCACAAMLKVRPGSERASTPRDVIHLIFCAGVTSALSAVLGYAAFLIRHQDLLVPPWETPRLVGFISWWLANVVSILFVVPLVSSFRDWTKRRSGRALAELALIVALAAICTDLAFRGVPPFAFVIYPILLWSGIRHREMGATLALLSAAIAAVHASRNQEWAYRELGRSVSHLRMIWMQLGFLVGGAGSLLVSTAVHAEAAMRAAQVGSSEKSQFLLSLNRSLKEPLRAIARAADLKGQPNASAEARSFFLAIDRNLQRAFRLTSDALDLSQTETGKVEIRLRAFSMHQWIDDVVLVHRLHAETKGLRLEVARDSNLPIYAVADPERLAQIATNLLSNAIKFTDRGHVRMSVRMLRRSPTSAPELELTVADSGPGISSELRSRLFEPFSQAAPDVLGEKRQEGSGLGLALSRDLARLMGGDLELVSTPDGASGCAFRLRTPFRPVRVP